MIPVRVFFSKTGRAKYISHLDLMRAMSRALKRSGLPVWYTEGFNPHMYLTFALPLSLGYESGRESMDFRLLEEIPMEEVTGMLSRHFPEGLEALSSGLPVMKPEAIVWADYRLILLWDENGPQKADEFTAFMNRDSIMAVKKTKKGEKEMDLAPLVKLMSMGKRENGFEASLRLASGITLNINPSLPLDQFYKEAEAPAAAHIRRTAVLTKDFEEFC